MESLKKKKKEMNVYNKTDTENKPVVTSRERERGGPRWGLGIKRYKVLYEE